MVTKIVYNYKDIQKEILEAVDTIADPVKQTLSPKGSNVIFEDERGGKYVTNDGVTIAKNIILDDPVKSAIVDIIKHSSLKTNSEAGDGTTTSIVLSQLLIKEGFKLIEEGINPIDLKKKLEQAADTLVSRLNKEVMTVTNDDELLNIATISANNDTTIAKDVVDIVKFAGEDGMIFIEPNNKIDTQINKEPGFRIESGMFSPDLRTSKHQFTADYKDVPVFITDKRIYYPEEAEQILKTAVKAGHKTIVVVARDFIGQAPNTFIANHSKGVINVLLIKEPNATETNSEVLDDLAMYLGGKVFKEKTGSIVSNLKESDFVLVNQVFCDPQKSIITPKVMGLPEVDKLVKELKKELDKDKENQSIKKRLASLTSGTTTVKIGGATPIEQSERVYRYEDAINATRSAIKDGYLVGGGIALIRAYNSQDYDESVSSLMKKMCQQSLKQISINCGKNPDEVIGKVLTEDGTYGYNALTDKYEDILKAGVVDPYKVTEMAVRNSISVANVILSSRFLIVNKPEEKHE